MKMSTLGGATSTHVVEYADTVICRNMENLASVNPSLLKQGHSLSRKDMLRSMLHVSGRFPS